MTQPPRRWSGSELPKELNAALSSADADISDQAVERLRARLGDALGPAFSDSQPTAAAQAQQPAAHALRLLTPGKWLGIGALFAIGFGVLWIRGPGAPSGHAERRLSAPSAVVTETGAGAVQGSVPEVVAAEPDEEPSVPPPTAAAAEVKSVSQPDPMVHASKKLARSSKPPKPAELGLAEELRQLEQIRQRLRVSPASALTEADTHARRFPHGTLGPERELLRVDALLRLGRDAEARKLAERMLAAPEGHPYRTQIEKLLAVH